MAKKKSCYNHAERQRLKHTKKTTMDLLLFGSIWVLRTKFGFGEVRILRFWNELFDLMDSIGKGRVKITDIRQAIYDECGIIFEEVNKDAL